MTSENVTKVLALINRQGYDSSTWNIETNEVDAYAHYGVNSGNNVLNPHIALWLTVDIVYDLQRAEIEPDAWLQTVDGNGIAIFNL